MQAWPIEEILGRPIASLALAAGLPFATAKLLRLVLLGSLPADPAERAQRLFPLRQASFLVGLAQIQLAWTAGATALGPGLLAERSSLVEGAFGALCALTAFVAGGIARRAEAPADDRPSARSAAILRLRITPLFAGPLIAAMAALELPLASWTGAAWTIRWEWVVVAFAICAAGTAYAGLALAVLTTALRPATAQVRRLARAVAEKERTSLWLVLRLPSTHFANAAALPWARTMIVSDALVAMLTEDELRAVLAHEAGHLSERPYVALGRLGAASLAIFALAVLAPLALTTEDPVASPLAIASTALALVALLGVRRLARRMEERADARAREAAGAAPLASALAKLHAKMAMPMVTGARRVHPDLYDRLAACGHDLGPRPAPPKRWPGVAAGLMLGLPLLLAPLAASELTEIDDVTTAGEGAAQWRLRIDPWDTDAMLASGWGASRRAALSHAELRLARARELGADEASALELEAQLHAQRGRCAEARAAFDRSREVRAASLFEAPWERSLTLGGYHLPPAMVERCPVP
ncbi:MAG: M48 family metalloprotease [Sandaracinaceae bacterium]|nr:M48 family metalloprotease [Sandaracinaceae bacterium]